MAPKFRFRFPWCNWWTVITNRRNICINSPKAHSWTKPGRRALHGLIPRRAILANRDISNMSGCPVCQNGAEDIRHKIFTCGRAKGCVEIDRNLEEDRTIIVYWPIMEEVYITPSTFGNGLHNPPTYETVYITPWIFQNRSNYPLKQFWKIIVNRKKIIKWKIQLY